MDLFDDGVDFDPGGDLGAFLARVPAKWVVYLMSDAAGQPVQLLCVKNLRASLKRRLGGQEMIGPTRKVNYRDVVRRVDWRRCDSAFEADWAYLEAARAVFPETYRGMVGFRPAWFIHVNPDAAFPRYLRTADLSAKSGMLLGPIEDKHVAQKLIQSAEDAFDLCRYYNLLLEAPNAKACAYKEMGRCPAPCDGSIPMEAYRRSVRQSARAIVNPRAFIGEQEERMRQAAGALQYELAGRIKAKIEQASRWGTGALRHVRRLEDFRFVSVQRGPRANTAKVFLVTPGRIELAAGLIAEPAGASDLLRSILARAEELRDEALPEKAAERIAVVSQHLLSPRKEGGVFILLDEVEDQSLLRAWKELGRQKVAEVEGDEEGVVKELQGM